MLGGGDHFCAVALLVGGQPSVNNLLNFSHYQAHCFEVVSLHVLPAYVTIHSAHMTDVA